jgi:hypothetical protein
MCDIRRICTPAARRDARMRIDDDDDVDGNRDDDRDDDDDDVVRCGIVRISYVDISVYLT